MRSCWVIGLGQIGLLVMVVRFGSSLSIGCWFAQVVVISFSSFSDWAESDLFVRLGISIFD